MSIEESIKDVVEAFPFKEYMSSNDTSHYSIASTVAKWVPAGGSVLDFASGPCDKTAVVQRTGFQCTACDDLGDYWHNLPGNRERIMQFAADEGIDFHLLESRELPFKEESFDMVMAHAVLDHLHDSPRPLLNKLISFIKPNGYLFISLPNAVNIRKRIAVMRGKTNMPPYDSYYWYPGSWRGHVREYVKDDLAQMAKFLQMEVVELHGCHHLTGRVPALIRPIYMAATAVFDGWRDSWTLVAKKPAGWVAKDELEPGELDEIKAIKAYQDA